MATNLKPRLKDHWSVRLRIKRPGGASSAVLIGLALFQTLLLVLTGSSLAQSGGLYACSTPCWTTPQPTTPLLAMLFGILVLAVPVALGALSGSWQEGVTLATIPWLIAVTLTSGALLAPVPKAVPATAQHPISTQFSAPFWLDANHVMPLLFSLALFAGLAWFGWIARHALSDA
ncbi:MAG: hypothetical protein ACXWQR_22610 [Ktedonobacterales bacterium]